MRVNSGTILQKPQVVIDVFYQTQVGNTVELYDRPSSLDAEVPFRYIYLDVLWEHISGGRKKLKEKYLLEYKNCFTQNGLNCHERTRFTVPRTSIREINCAYCIEISGKFNVFLSEDISATDATSLMLKAFNEHADVQDVSVIELLKGRNVNSSSSNSSKQSHNC
ncbi:hypothetical protein EAG_04865 [Camponotus floridanus]|uniref:Uncharacterized protein n=1 Tax=Camponotus floridanus TaxID=104421 RepID=E2ASJ4_CAMFO|nr:hypothetical protein EAG_04865 [Camponotus floridanus]